MNKVYILGGGVAGLSAAHELAERGFEVIVFERLDICGGKARSMKYAGTGTGGRVDLPGEHGFRFFPGFYFHLTDTMSRIVVDPLTGATADQNLVTASEIGIAQNAKPIFKTAASHPSSFEEWVSALRQLFDNPSLGVPPDEARVFLRKLLCFLGAGRTRRVEQYEKISWLDFIEATGKSSQYHAILARGLSQSLVAMRPDKASTLTVASMLVQIVVNILEGKAADRVLNAPTSESWIDPWVKQLTGKPNVTILNSHRATQLSFNSVANEITSVTVTDQNGTAQSWGDNQDYYIAAVPVEIVQKDATLFPTALKHAAGLSRPAAAAVDAGVDRLETEWMSGVLFYMNRDVSAVHGHVIYAHSAWALTSISQRQFWGASYPWAGMGNGQVQDILSTIISDWDALSPSTGSSAKASTRGEILAETWAQLKTHLAQAGNGAINDTDRVDTFIDPAIKFDVPGPGGRVVSNDEPLLINTKDSRTHRPRAATNVPNLLVAADYVLTETDLACMEAANEAARAAVNEVIRISGSPATPCEIRPLKEPEVFRIFQAADELDYAQDPTRAPLLCRYLDQLLPPGPPPPPGSPFSNPAVLLNLILNGANLALLALLLYLLLKS